MLVRTVHSPSRTMVKWECRIADHAQTHTTLCTVEEETDGQKQGSKETAILRGHGGGTSGKESQDELS